MERSGLIRFFFPITTAETRFLVARCLGFDGKE